MLTGSLGLALLCVVVVVAGCVAVTAEAKHHFIGNALMDMKDSIELSFKLGKAVVSVLMEELTEDIIEAQKRLALRTLQKDSQDIPSVISSVIGAIQSVTPYQKLDKDLTMPPVEVFPADKGKDIGVTIFPKPILDIPDVDSIPATERENNVIIENPPYIPKSIIDIFPEHVNEGETIIRMDGRFGSSEKNLPSAKNLYGKDFEDYLTKNIGGEGSFSKGGRDFDGGIGNRWWEAKSGSFWENRLNDAKAIAKFKSDMGDRLRIASENGATYELFSNTPIPQVFKDYLIKKGIPFTEILH